MTRFRRRKQGVQNTRLVILDIRDRDQLLQLINSATSVAADRSPSHSKSPPQAPPSAIFSATANSGLWRHRSEDLTAGKFSIGTYTVDLLQKILPAYLLDGGCRSMRARRQRRNCRGRRRGCPSPE